jgi:hypothetical protein
MVAGIPGTGGLPPRRIDQLRAQVPTGIQPGSASNVVRARTIIVSGTGEGVFVYTGRPALGNPPILSIVSPGTTADPYGNTVEAVLTVGSLAGAHVLVDDDGNISLVSAAGNSGITLNPTTGTITFADPATGAVEMQIAESTLTGEGFIELNSGVTPDVGDAAAGLIIQSKDLTVGGFSGQVAVGTGTPSPVTAGLLEVDGTITVTDTAAASLPAAQDTSAMLYGSSGHLAVQSGDSQLWDTEKRTVYNSGSHTVNGTTPQSIGTVSTAGDLPTLEAGVVYRVRAFVPYEPTTNASTTSFDIELAWISGGGAPTFLTLTAEHWITDNTGDSNAGLSTTLPAVSAGPPMVAAQQAFCRYEGMIEPATAGILGILCATAAAGDVVTVLAGTFISFEPISVGS